VQVKNRESFKLAVGVARRRYVISPLDTKDRPVLYSSTSFVAFLAR
jgi:hypothetical protein